jgi:hypothetical protein
MAAPSLENWRCSKKCMALTYHWVRSNCSCRQSRRPWCAARTCSPRRRNKICALVLCPMTQSGSQSTRGKKASQRGSNSAVAGGGAECQMILGAADCLRTIDAPAGASPHLSSLHPVPCTPVLGIPPCCPYHFQDAGECALKRELTSSGAQHTFALDDCNS